jgi:ribonuclease P protein component, eubacterial
VFRSGSSAANRQFVVYWKRKPGQPHFRLGVSASKKLGNAVVRNRMRRLVKEIVRLHGGRIAPECDLVVIVRKDATQMEFDELERSLKHVLKKAGVWLPAAASAAPPDHR